MFSKEFGYPAYIDAECGNFIECKLENYTVKAQLVQDLDTNVYKYANPGDCFDLEHPTNGEANQKIVKSWDDGEWLYCGVVLTVSLTESKVTLLDRAASLWGLELNLSKEGNAYLLQVANDLLPEALEAADEVIEGLRPLKSYRESVSSRKTKVSNLEV